MPAIDYTDLPEHNRRKLKPAIAWSIGALATFTVVALGTTLASNLALNNNSTVEFGQGMAATVSCQSTPLTITPTSSYDNGTGKFLLSGLNISGITIDTPQNCLNDYFKVAIWPSSGSLSLMNFYLLDPNGTWNTGGGDTGSYLSQDTLTMGRNGPDFINISTLSNGYIDSSGLNNIPASLINKITIESSSILPALDGEIQSLCEEGGNCNLGDIGPGGGTVFYVSTAFSELYAPCASACHYLEAALTTGPNAWDDSNGGNLFAWSPVARLGGTYSGLGYGFFNSENMRTQSTDLGFAGTSSRDYRGPNNLSDWFLPSQTELRDLALQSTIINTLGLNNYNTHRYWSSTEAGISLAIAVGIHGNNIFEHDKSFLHYVRPIRAF